MDFAARVRDVVFAGNDDWFAEFENARYSWGELGRAGDWFAQAIAQTALPDELAIAIILRNRPSAVSALAGVWAAQTVSHPD